MGAGLAGRPPCLPHSQVLLGAGLAGGPPCLPHWQVLMCAELAESSSSSMLKPEAIDSYINVFSPPKSIFIAFYSGISLKLPPPATYSVRSLSSKAC